MPYESAMGHMRSHVSHRSGHMSSSTCYTRAPWVIQAAIWAIWVAIWAATWAAAFAVWELHGPCAALGTRSKRAHARSGPMPVACGSHCSRCAVLGRLLAASGSKGSGTMSKQAFACSALALWRKEECARTGAAVGGPWWM